MAEEKMSLIEELQNPPRVDGGTLDESRVIDLMKTAAFALSTQMGILYLPYPSANSILLRVGALNERPA